VTSPSNGLREEFEKAFQSEFKDLQFDSAWSDMTNKFFKRAYLSGTQWMAKKLADIAHDNDKVITEYEILHISQKLGEEKV